MNTLSRSSSSMYTHLLLALIITFSLFQPTSAAVVGSLADQPASSHIHQSGKLLLGSTIYVNWANTSGVEDGTQDHPFNTIQEGIIAASNGDMVQVAAGTYREKITLKSGVQLFGSGAEVTRIDGADQGDSVVTASDTGTGTAIDGFSIVNGSGKTNGSYTYGGGLHISNSNLIVSNCQVVDNRATDGAGGLQSINSVLTIDHSTFRNDNGWWGAAITIDGGVAELRNSIIDNSNGGYGGVVFLNGTQATLVNNLIMHNSSRIPAIGIGSTYAVTITNNTITANASGGIETNTYYSSGSSGTAVIKNNILWGNGDDLVNLTATYSDIKDGDAGEGNISIDPAFVKPENGDFHLQPVSPCIDKGINAGSPSIDLEGDPRPFDGDGDGMDIVDMGADELPPLSVSLAGINEILPGYPLTYILSIQNSLSISISNVILTDTLPLQTSYVDGSIIASTGIITYTNGIISWTGSFGPSGTVMVQFQTIVDKAVPIGTPLINSMDINIAGKGIKRSSTLFVDQFHNYLAVLLLTKPTLPSITGMVTFKGSPVVNRTLDLRFYNGAEWSTAANATTDMNGRYEFPDVTPPEPGQAYYVLFLNSADPEQLYRWNTKELTDLPYYSKVDLGSFDIANIVLTTPKPGASVKLPYTFKWTVRPATLTDSYEFDLFDFTDHDPWFYTDPLGYTGSYRLAQRPPGFLNGVYYGWDLGVDSPDGGYGISFYYYYIKFSSSPGGLASFEMKSGNRGFRSAWLAPGIPADR